MRTTRNPRRGSSAGFTLIEVTIALAIVGIGMATMIALTGTALRNATAADQYLEATRRAQSRLSMVGVTTPLVPGDTSGNDGGGYGWRIRVSDPSIHPDPPKVGEAPPPAIYGVDVTINWPSSHPTRQITLTTQRLGPVQGAPHE